MPLYTKTKNRIPRSRSKWSRIWSWFPFGRRSARPKPKTFAFAPLAFAVGDTIAISLPNGGYGLAVIGRLNAERMFCTTFTPRFWYYPDEASLAAWEPDGRSSWVVDTTGLRDGSWVKVPEPPAMSRFKHIDVHHLPRFKFVSDKTGEPGLAEYDPDSLRVRRMIRNPDLKEYENAPTLIIPQDATTFEVALSRNLGVWCDLPEPDALDVLNQDRLVVALLRQEMNDPNADLVFDHAFVLDRRSEAERLRSELEQLGLDVGDLPEGGDPFDTTFLEVRLRSKAEYPLVRKDIEKMRELAYQYGAEYDGFGALPI